MTHFDVLTRLSEIRKMAATEDYEVAHNMEERMWRSVLRAIAKGEGDPPAVLAKAALQVDDLDHPRW